MISAIGGTGGIGKTWLALTWAHRNLHRFPDGQLSVDLRGFSPGEPRHVADVLADFLVALGVDRDHQPTELDARVSFYRTHTAGKRILILLDNAATPDQVVPLLPGGDSCTVLITSRNRLRSLVARHSARPVHLDVLTDAEARTLLTTVLNDHTRTGAQRTITDLIGLCGGFPLALGLIAARIRSQSDLLDDLVAELRELGLDALDSDDPSASLPTVLSWSLRHLTEEQRTLFGLIGLAPGLDTTLPAVASLADLPSVRAHKALSALEDASLIGRRPQGRYAMHDLVRDYATTTAHTTLPDSVQEGALTRVMDFYLYSAFAADRLLNPHRQLLRPGPPAPGVHPIPLLDTASAMAWLEAEHAILLATQRAACTLGRHSVVWHLAWTLDTFHRQRGHRHDALTAWQAALDAAPYLTQLAARSRAHLHLGRACARLSMTEEAASHLNQALSLAERHRDPTGQAHTHRALAFAWGRRGDDRRALDHAQRALDLHRTLDQPTWEADSLNAVGWFAARVGEFDSAQTHCDAALALHRRHHNPTGEATTLNSLGFIAHRTGEHRQAITHYQMALKLSRALSNTYKVADTLDNLGHPHAALGQRDQAQAAWREALELYLQQGRDTDVQRLERQLHDLGNSTYTNPDDS